MSTTAESVIDRAVSRHWSFESNYSDGAALYELHEQQKAFLLDLGRVVSAIIGTTQEILTSLTNAALIAVDENNVPYFTTTQEPGYAVQFDDSNVPYFTLDNPLIIDPFGEDGDTPGLPLPDDLLRLIYISAKTEQNRIVPIPVNVLEQEVVRRAPVRTGLYAYLSANRIIPVRTSEADLWSQVTSLQIGCIICPQLTALTDVLTIPSPCLPALTAAMIKYFSDQARECPASDKRQFAMDAAAEYEKMLWSVNAMDAVTQSTVIHKR